MTDGKKEQEHLPLNEELEIDAKAGNNSHDRIEVLKFPVVPLRGISMFPETIFSFDIGRKKSLASLEKALDTDRRLFLAPQKVVQVSEPILSDLHEIGLIVDVKQFFRTQGDLVRIIAEGLKRAKIINFFEEEGYWVCEAVPILEENDLPPDENDIYLKALIKSAKEQFELIAELYNTVPRESLFLVQAEERPGKLADLIMANIHAEFEKKQLMLEELDPIKRLNETLAMLLHEIELTEMQKGLLDKAHSKIQRQQKEYYIREQIKVLQEEIGIGEGDEDAKEIQEYKDKIEKLNLEPEVSEKLLKEVDRLSKMTSMSQEAAVLRNYLDYAIELPWNVKSKETQSLEKAEKIINKNHYGLDKVKERVLEYLAVRQNAPLADSPIICLSGPPGSGKTSVAKSIAEALNRKYVRMSLGGVRDEAEIRGHRKTYVGAMPGRIITAMKQAGTKNPLILFDEIDKMSQDYKGDPAAALLEVLDAAQNSTFRDNFLEVPFDLSDVVFICTANNVSQVPPALLDRLELIDLSGYSENEKVSICTLHLIPSQLKKHGLKKSQLQISEDIIKDIINGYTRESGVRQLERNIAAICRKTVKAVLKEGKKKIVVTDELLVEFLGMPKYKKDEKFKKPEVGAVKGLAWTGYGGDTLSVEVNIMRGAGKFELTGNMGDVMKESAKAAMSYIRANASNLHIDEKFYKDTDIHIHIPEGAVPKDGPSAGITMATAIISALTNVPIDMDIAMTGEITIRGNVLPVGGLKEKLLAGKRSGIKTVLVPSKNKSDISEIPDEVKEGINILYVSDMSEVLANSIENRM